MSRPYVNQTQVSESTPFDNGSNGYIGDNAQSAIEESRSKCGFITYTSFTGNPKTAVVTFNPPFPPGTTYGVVISGVDKRTWSSENHSVNGFTINTNANQPITDSVFWVATRTWG
jgi:hypothetical protein